MSDRTDHGERDRHPGEDRPKRSHPLFWLLVLAALLAFGWSFYNQHASRQTPAMVTPDLTPAVPARKDAANPPQAPGPRR
jgi:hypothetical protein